MSTSDKKLIRIAGRVVERKTKQGLPGLRVEAWDKDLIVKEAVAAAAATDPQGAFIIEVAKGRFNELFAGRHAVLFFKVFRDDQLIASTEGSVLWDRDAPAVDVVIKVSPDSPKIQNTFVVSGQVRRADNSAFTDGAVQALLTLRGQQSVLGETKTDAGGHYEIAYALDDAQLGQLADLRVVARVFDGKKNQLAESPAFIPDNTATVNLTVPNLPPLFLIHGRVLRKEKPVSSVTVRLFGVLPSPEAALGDPAITNSEGFYQIQYEPGRFNGDKDQNSRVQVRVSDGSQRELFMTPLFRSEGDILLDLRIEPQIEPQAFIVRGHVTRQGGGAFDGIVRVFSVATGRQLGQDAPTGNAGEYEIRYEAATSGGTVAIGEAVIVRVFDGLGRERAHSETFNAQPLKEINLEVTALPDEEQTFVVEGRVTRSGDIAFVGGIVRAFDRDLRSEQRLGESPTDAAGHYQIRYSASQFRRSEKGSADLIVRAFDAGGSLQAASPILFNAPAIAQVDLIIPADRRPLSLFERISSAILPLLDGVKVEELEEDEQHQDVSFLSGETGFDKADIARFIIAHKPALQAIQAEFWFALLGGPLFQFAEGQSLQNQLTALLEALSLLDAVLVRKELIRGFNQQEIPDTLQGRVDEWVAAFLDFVARRLIGGGARPSFVQSALEDANIRDAGRQQRFARLFIQYKDSTPALLDALAKDPGFSRTELDDLHTSFNLADLTRGDFSVVKMIKDQFQVRQPLAIRVLAKNSESDWVNLITAKYQAGQINLPIETGDVQGAKKLPAPEVYGKTLERQFREAFPTTAFAGGLSRALNSGSVRGLRHADALNRFLDQYPDFELLNTPVDEFFKNEVDPDGQSRGGGNQDLMPEVKAVQRVFKLAPTFAATDALLADGVHSAQQIYRIGETGFVQRYAGRTGLTAEDARLAWNRAADTHAAVITVVGDLKGFQSDTLPAVLQNGGDALSTFPNWNNLFQTGDICECEHCRSVLSPAAYFADLLMFLRDRKAANPAFTVKDILFRRRPDLGYLELNCENALTTLPYIDVVCEVLEAVVAAGENDVELTGFTLVPGGTAAAKAAVAAAFAAKHISLGADFSLSQVDPSDPNRWVAHGDDVTYLLKKKATPNFFAEVLRNTKTSAAELRAYPQYVNSKAYEKLRAAMYPLALPFDLFAEEVRAAFQKPDLKRWDLMHTLRGPAAPNNPSDGDIAAEYFGISVNPAATVDEKRLILVTNATVGGQQAVWGETGAGWLGAVSNVKNFLQKTGLEYNDLLALLDLKWINPAGDIAVHHQDTSCDTDKKDIQTLDAAKLDRIHRFLRFYRKLSGWKVWELDRVIRHPSIGNGSLNEAFLINLIYFVEVKNRLGATVTVEQVTALFGDLNSRTRFTRLYEKRGDAIYQQLFLNKRLINPPDPAFEINPTTGDLKPGQTITAHHPVVLAALGIREADLVLLKGLTRASDGSPYINDDLNLANLSFLWRHAWLSKLLKFKVEEWKLVLKIVQQNLLTFTDPKAAFEFLEGIAHLKATGFKPDELNWLLAADRSAKAAVKESDAVRFLTGLRKDLQGIHAEYDPAKYPFLAPPTDEEQLVALLTSLLQKLNRDEAGINSFLLTLRGGVILQAAVDDLPAGFMFPAAITGAPNHLPIQYDEPNKLIRFTGLMSAAQRAALLADASLSAVSGDPAYQSAIEALFQQSLAARTNFLPTDLQMSLPGGISLPADRPSIPLRYDAPTQTVTFIGVMTDAEQAALKSVPANPAAVIDELFERPRLAVKFYEPVFAAPLMALLPSIDFKAQLSADLSAKIAYDVEQRLLRFTGIMRADEQAALNALAPNLLPDEVAYHNAVNSVAVQPQSIASPDERVWLSDSDLDASQAANDTFAKRLANAAVKALAHLSTTLSENLAVQQCSESLGLTAATARAIMTRFQPLPPDSALALLTGAFSHSTGAISYAVPYTDAMNTWYWLNRVVQILKQWKISLEDLEHLISLKTPAEVIDFTNLPLHDAQPIAPVEKFLRMSRLLRLRDALPETGTTFFEVLENLSLGAYPAASQFAADVQLLNPDWLSEDVAALIAAFDLTYPADYFLVESWERLRRAFYFLESLNAGADVVKTFAMATMTDAHAKTLKELLRSKFGPETWLTLSAEIQDVLRERKRDALAAYRLAQPQPSDAPSGKWENTNDLYAYYLLDVEMSACQLTSRLVQASGSIQLFVQRGFMGLEPDVVVRADGTAGDSAWRWWKWMRKYRVWEANRKVFLWPENWIEPELKKDRSPFFKDLENELLQNEVNPSTVEAAFSNYLEKLAGVAQLEIAGFFQEDDGDNAIVHVFGRTAGAEPHLYYYRRYDYHQWTPWEKVEMDIQSDYLIPAVINKRLFLFWPVFMETSDEQGNSMVSTPSASQSNVPVQKTKRILKLQMAVSEYRQGKWTPRRVSKDFDQSLPYDVEIVRKYYRFFAVDRSEIDGRFGIKYDGYSLGSDKRLWANMSGAFEIAGCNGAPERASLPGIFRHAFRPEYNSTGSDTSFLKWVESRQLQPGSGPPQNDFSLTYQSPTSFQSMGFTPVLLQTPGIFEMSPPWHLSYFDKLALDGLLAFILFPVVLLVVGGRDGGESLTLVGSWLPFFYNDKKRTFFVLPSFGGNRDDASLASRGSVRSYYPEIKKSFRQLEDYFAGQVQTWLDGINLSALTPSQRQELEQFIGLQFPEALFPEEPPPPYTPETIKVLLKRFAMRFFHKYLGAQSLSLFQLRHFHFKNFYHPFVCDFARLVYNPLKGIPALMSRDTQLKDSGFGFRQTYQPTAWVVEPPTESFYPREIVDFSPDGAYSPYNWELFFHVPLLIANALSKNQRFEEARDWYHFIFNPVGVESSVPGGSPMSKYWITKPFFETTDPQYVKQRIDNILRMLAGDPTVPGFSAAAKKDLEDQVLDWRVNPFEPHRIANYRTVAYQKTVVMKYLDNLIEWGDNLFRQDSMESINEAAQLYILAAEILGPRPKQMPPQARPPQESFNELEKAFDDFSNALVEVENLVPPLNGNLPNDGNLAPLPMLYFCIPKNDKMLGYWDKIADRLFKIRHCMNIEGVVRQLPLFEPPIDPAALVKAVAGGIDLASALADLNAPLPLYRFNVLLQKAGEVCNDVKTLGSALLAAFEKKDAEAMSLLRQGQERQLLQAVKAVREKQIEEAKENLQGIKRNRELAEVKKQYYESREFMNAGEIVAISLSTASTAIDTAVAVGYILSGGLKAVPQFIIGAAGFGGSPHATAETGGRTFGEIAEDAVQSLSAISHALDKMASLANTLGSYQRRKEEWNFQRDLAVKELAQIDSQIAAAELRIAIAEKELDNHVLQIENAKAVEDFMRSKYTNQELYQWQVGQISGVYFQSYKLAYDLAKRAERCFRFELGLPDSSFINFGYWDSLKKGLLAGEKLQYDLRRLETAYIEQNRRELELTKRVSLRLLDPLALIKLRETGRCFFRLPEEIFDLDYPGHYFRRIKSVSLTLPCVVGPYTTSSGTLRLLKNSVRINTTKGDGYPRNTDEQGAPADDPRFVENNIPVKAMAASHAQNDSGMFEMNFRDERYLPFEGAGAISEWSLELFNDASADFGKPLRQFDYGTITDAILDIKYTAREDAGAFKNAAVAYLREYLYQDNATPSLQLFNLRQEFPTQWHRFLNPAAGGNVFELQMSSSLFPFRDEAKTLKVNFIWLLARCTDPGSYTAVLSPPLTAGSDTLSLVRANQFGGLHLGQKDLTALGIEIPPAGQPVDWQFKVTRLGGGNLQKDPVKQVMEIEDMFLVLGYEWQ